MTSYKTLLTEKQISVKEIAKRVNISKAVVSDVINDKYKGSEQTKQRILSYIDFALVDKVDLNELIYANIDLFMKGFWSIIRNPKNVIPIEDTSIYLEFYNILHSHKKHLSQNQTPKTNE